MVKPTSNNALEQRLKNHFANSYELQEFLSTQAFDGIWLWHHTEALHHLVSDRLAKNIGYSNPHAFVDNWQNIIHPDDIESFSNTAFVLPYSQKQPSSVVRFFHRNGKTLWFKYHCILNRSGSNEQETGFIFFTDITKEKNIESRLRHKSQEAFNLYQQTRASLTESDNLFEFSPDALIQVNRQGQIIRVNQQACSLFEYSKDDMLQMNVDDLVPDQFRKEHAKHRAAYQKKPAIRPMGKADHDFYAKTRSGKNIPVEIHLATIQTKSGFYPVAAVRDISSRKALESSLRKATKTAEMAARRKTEFLSNMSHEIRTPLNGILGIIELLQGNEDEHEKETYLEILQQSGNALLAIINDILDGAKIFEGKVRFKKNPFNLEKVVVAVTAAYQIQKKDKVTMLTDIDSNVPLNLKGDDSRLQQMLNNLLSNAFKFTRKGEVRLQVSLVEADNDKAIIRFIVSDTGIGIPESYQQKIFEQFEQVDSTATRNYGGSGLGLAICKALISLAGGQIALQSQVGKGSTFTVDLPFDISKPLPQTSRKQKPPMDFSSLRVLLVEDNIVNATIITSMLEKIGVDCDLAENGLQAVEQVCHQSCHYDLVLMDCDMPVLDGFEASRRIRRYEDTVQADKKPHIPICALTAHALQEQKQACFDSGMDCHLPKPVSMKDLRAVLETCHQPELLQTTQTSGN